MLHWKGPRWKGLAVLVPLALAATTLAGCGADPPPLMVGAVPGDGSATVTWLPPLASPAPIVAYVVTPLVGRVAQTPTRFDSTDTSQTVTSLTNGTAYTFMVAAINAIGTETAYSDESNVVTPLPWICNPSDTAINDGHEDAFFAAYTEPKGPLSWTDCQAVVADLDQAEAFVSQYPTVADAEAAGWIEAAVWAPGQGIHFVDQSRMTGPFDPTRPNWLMYDGTNPDSKLTGMMFLTDSGSSPPAGFPGGNDHWHFHHMLCIDNGATPFVIGEHLTDAECAAIGGVNTDVSNLWMLHVWLPAYAGWQATDIFNMMHPALMMMMM